MAEDGAVHEDDGEGPQAPKETVKGFLRVMMRAQGQDPCVQGPR